MNREPEVNLNLVETSITEKPVYFSIFDPRTWINLWNRRFLVTFTVPATEKYEVSQCFAYPRTNPAWGHFECLLLISFKECTRNSQKVTPFYAEFAVPSHLSQVTFNLAVQVKHPVHVSL
jgi:hypothetical protein